MHCGIRILDPHTFDRIEEKEDCCIFWGTHVNFFHYIFAPYFIDKAEKHLLLFDQRMSFFDMLDTGGERYRIFVGIYDKKDMRCDANMLYCPDEIPKYLKKSIFCQPYYPVINNSSKYFVSRGGCELWETVRKYDKAWELKQDKRYINYIDIINRLFFVVDMCPCVDFFIWCKNLKNVLELWPERNIFPVESPVRKIMDRDYRTREDGDKDNNMCRDNVWLGVEEKEVKKSIGIASLLCAGLWTYGG